MTNWNRRDRRHTTFHRHYFHAIRWSGGPGPFLFGLAPPPRRFAPGRTGRRCFASRQVPPKTRQRSSYDGRFSFHIAVSKRRAADATPRRKASAARHAKAPASHRQRGKQRAPTSCAPRPGWRWLAHSYGVRFLYLPTNSQNSTRKLLRLTIIDRAPGEILPFQLIVETGYFPFKAWRAGFLRKPFSIRALAGIDQTTLGCLVDFLLQQSRAGAKRHANRAVSTLTKARAVTRTRPPRGRCLPAPGITFPAEKSPTTP